MGGSIHLAEMFHCHERIYLRRGDGRVAEEFLDHPDVRAAIEQVGGERVPQRMRRDIGEARPARGGAQHHPGTLPSEPASARVEKHRGPMVAGRPLAARRGECWPPPDEIGLERGTCIATRGHHPVLSTLSSQPNGTRRVAVGSFGATAIGRTQLKVGEVKANSLGDPRSCPVQQLKERTVAQRGRLTGSGRSCCLDQALDLGDGNRFGQPPRWRRWPHVPRWVGHGEAFTKREGMQTPYRDDRAGSGPRRERRMSAAALPETSQERRDVLLVHRREARFATGRHRIDVAAQVSPVGFQRVPGETTLDGEVLHVTAHLTAEVPGDCQPSTSSRLA